MSLSHSRKTDKCKNEQNWLYLTLEFVTFDSKIDLYTQM